MKFIVLALLAFGLAFTKTPSSKSNPEYTSIVTYTRYLKMPYDSYDSVNQNLGHQYVVRVDTFPDTSNHFSVVQDTLTRAQYIALVGKIKTANMKALNAKKFRRPFGCSGGNLRLDPTTSLVFRVRDSIESYQNGSSCLYDSAYLKKFDEIVEAIRHLRK